MSSLILNTSINDENPSTFRQDEEINNTNAENREKMGNLECDKSLTISSGGYENLPSPNNFESVTEGKVGFHNKNVSEINFGRRFDENLMTKQKNNEEFLKFVNDNSGKLYHL